MLAPVIESNPSPMPLIESMLDQLYAYATRLTGSTIDAEDVVQSVCLRAVRFADRIDTVENKSGYLMRMVRNEAFRLSKKNSVTLAEQFESGSDSRAYTQLENVDSVQSALAQLPENHRGVLLAFYFEELSYQEIADEFDIAIGTVMSRLSRAKEAMKKVLESQ